MRFYTVLVGTFAIVFSAISVCNAQDLKVHITSKNQHRFTRIPDLAPLKLKAACYRRSSKVSVLGVMKRNYFEVPIKIKRSRLSGQEKLSVAQLIRKASARCKGSPTPTQTPAPTATPTTPATQTASPARTIPPTPTPTSTVTQPSVPIPQLALWQSRMLTYGAQNCARMTSPTLTFDEKLSATYYDAEWVFYRIGDYTGNSFWYSCAQAAEAVYRDTYVTPNNGVVPGYWNFSHGLTRDFLSTADSASRGAAVLLSQNAAFAPDTTPLSWTQDAELSREVAYTIMSYLNAELLGQPHRARCDAFVAQALGHLDQWFASQTAEYVRPFMFALTAHALISYDSQIGGNTQILPALINGANWIWEHTWLPQSGAFMYTDKVVSSGGMEPAPDLNLLIAPVYAWLWHKTGNPVFRDRADLIFQGGVLGAFLGNGKQFNQNYRWSFDYITWRSMPPH